MRFITSEDRYVEKKYCCIGPRVYRAHYSSVQTSVYVEMNNDFCSRCVVRYRV